MHGIDIDRVAGLVGVRFTGCVAVADRRRALEECKTVLVETGCRKVLVDFWDATFALDDFNTSNAFASRLAFDDLLRRCRTAHLVKPDTRINPIVHALATARGFSFCLFDERSRALLWLLRESVDLLPQVDAVVPARRSRWAGMHPADATPIHGSASRRHRG